MDNANYRMVFDSGSKQLKCAIATDTAQIIAFETLQLDLIISPDGFSRERNTKTTWPSILQLIQKTIKSAGIDPKSIRYITSSSIRPSCVFADSENTALYIGSSFDLGGIDYADELDEQFEEIAQKSFYESTGHHPSLLFCPGRYLFCKSRMEAQGDTGEIAQYLPFDSWILMKLGAEAHANYMSAAESGFFDLHEKTWHTAWNTILDLPDYFFPWPVAAGEIVGTISEEIHQEIGLSPECELVAGLPDTQAALLGGQCIRPGNLAAVLGSTTPVQALTENLFLEEQQQTWSTLFTVKNLADCYILEANTGITGQNLKWAANLFYSETAETLEKRYAMLGAAYRKYDAWEILAEPQKIQENSVVALLGPQPLASSQTAITPGLFHFQSPGGVEETQASQDAFITSIYDNIQFAITENIRILKERLHISPERHTILGGVARDRTLVQRFADLLETPVITTSHHEATIHGLLILCDIAAGSINTADALLNRNENHKILDSYRPRAAMVPKLANRFTEWKKLFKKYQL